MTDRPSLGPDSGVIPGTTFFAEYKGAMKGLFDSSHLPLVSVAGTADDVTAVCNWELDGGVLVEGMKFSITWVDDNTGPATLSVNGGSPVAVLDSSGGVLVASSVESGRRDILEYVSGSFRILTASSAGVASARYRSVFTSSGTWNKPSGLDDNAQVRVQVWAGGGGGGPNSGGGGGGYTERVMRAADVPSSVTVTVGAGGAAGANGANSSFGSLVVAYGGARGQTDIGGGGGGEVSAGFGQTPGSVGGGAGGINVDHAHSSGSDSRTIWGGGGGGSSGVYTSGGAAVFGGGGGGVPGGVSVYAGSGGVASTAGQAPAGGGGSGAPGARGEVIVWI